LASGNATNGEWEKIRLLDYRPDHTYSCVSRCAGSAKDLHAVWSWEGARLKKVTVVSDHDFREERETLEPHEDSGIYYVNIRDNTVSRRTRIARGAVDDFDLAFDPSTGIKVVVFDPMRSAPRPLIMVVGDQAGRWSNPMPIDLGGIRLYSGVRIQLAEPGRFLLSHRVPGPEQGAGVQSWILNIETRG